MSPRWGSTPRLTDRLTVGRNVTLTLSTPQSSLVSCRERVVRIQKSEYLGRAPVSQSWSVSRVAQSRVYSEVAVFREEFHSCRRTDPAVLEDRKPVRTE
jgi:hypothetical protein